MRKIKAEAGKICPKCGKAENQKKIGYNASGTQRCKCKECGTRYTINPKRRAYPQEVREQAIKMYYAGASCRTVGKVLHINKSNVMNWIKKERQEESWEVENLWRKSKDCRIGWALLVYWTQGRDWNSRKYVYYDDGQPASSANHGIRGEYRQNRTDDPEDGGCSSRSWDILHRWVLWLSGCGLPGNAYLQYPQQKRYLYGRGCQCRSAPLYSVP